METLQRTANRGSISTGGYEIEYSNKFESDNSEGIIRNYDASTGANCIANNSTTNAKKFTVSYWVKKTELLASGQNIPWIAIAGGNATVVKFQDEKFAAYDDSAGWSLATNAVFRDTSAWYHLVCAVDTTQSTASDRVNLYVNGVLQTSFSTENYGTQNNDNQLWKVNTGHMIGNSSYFKGGYIAEVHCIDGTQYAASDFGKYDDDSGIWIPKEADVTYGDQGYYLNWSDFSSANSNANNTGVGKDHSGNTNPFSNLSNWSSADIATDTPTNNFCTWIPLWTFPKVAGIENGGTSTNAAFNASTWRGAKGSMGVSRGKWYWEQKASGNDTIVGWQTDNCVPDSGTNSHNVISTIAYYEGGNFLWIKDSTSGRNADTMSGTYAGGQIDGMALDLDSSPQTVTFYRNGTAILSNRDIDGLADQTLFPITSHYNQTSDANFGGYTNISNAHTNTDENGYGSFVYAPPSGYYALCTKNLAEYG